MRAGLCLRARGGKRKSKDLVKLGQNEATGGNRRRPGVDQKSSPMAALGLLFICARSGF
jgi:hypothetical protein